MIKLTPRNAGAQGVLKVLTLGHSLALDCGHMLTRIVAEEGYSDLKLGTLYISGCPLHKHVQCLTDNAPEYSLYLSSTAQPEQPPTITNRVTMEYALELEDWDVIVMQGGVFEIADPDYFQDGNIQTIQSYVRTKCPNAKFVWHMPWAPPVDNFLRDQYPYPENNSYYIKYKPYNDDRSRFYQDIAASARDHIANDETFVFVIPTGTAMENALASGLKETDLHCDFVHATDFARLMNAYLWFCKFAGLEELTDVKLDKIPAAFLKSIESTEDWPLPAREKAILLASVNHALKSPFKMTPPA